MRIRVDRGIRRGLRDNANCETFADPTTSRRTYVYVA